MEQTEGSLLHEEKKERFIAEAITHRLLEQTDRAIMRAIRMPAGFAFVLVYGPTGVGKTRMIELIAERLNRMMPAPPNSLSFSLPRLSFTPIPLLVIEAKPPDGSPFNRAYFYRTALTLMGERTYQQQFEMDIHADQEPPKRRRVPRAAAQFNDVPELREATEGAMHRHGVQVVIVDEAHHMLYPGSGSSGSTLQEQLEWLKSLSSTTKALYILVGTYDLLSFGRLNGQMSRRSLPIHFPRYQLQREEDCIEFQSALLELLRRVPLKCEAEAWVTYHWLYFYERSVGCIGILKDWLVRAVCTALDEGQDILTLDQVQDHALQVGQCQQMTLDASEGEQKLNYTEAHREHLWRLLQGGELIAPVPPLPPRETPPPEPVKILDTLKLPLPLEQTPLPLASSEEEAPATPVKKTRTRKKPKENPPTEPLQGNVTQAEPEEAKAPDPPKRRRKKTGDPVVENAEAEGKVLSSVKREASSEPINADDTTPPTKPKRTRRVGEPKPKRYAVGKPEEEHHV